MRIAIISKSFAQSNNDWAVPPLIDYVRALARHAHVDVYALHYPLVQRTYQTLGVRVFSFDLGRRSRLTRRLDMRGVGKILAQEHQRKPYDVIHAAWADMSAQIGVACANDLGVPLVTTLYAGEAAWVPEISYGSMGAARHRKNLQNVLRRSDAVTCGSQFLATQVEGELGVPPEVIPFGLVAENFRPTGDAAALAGKTPIITSGSLSAVKGHAILVDAFRALADTHPTLMDGLHWHFVGPDALDGTLRQSLQHRFGALPMTLHDGVPHWEMAAQYRGAKLAVLGSWFESQCLAVMEAAACGLPVAGTAVGVLPQIASPDWVCPPGDVDAMKELLVRVLSDRKKWPQEAGKQSDWISKNGQVDTSVKAFLRLYTDLARSV